MNVFVSSCELADHGTEALINALRSLGVKVTHSPNPQPSNWYSDGIKAALLDADVCVSVLTPLWECSSWMQYEAFAGLQALQAGDIRRFVYFNPRDMKIAAAGMTPILLERLPDLPDNAAEDIVSSLT
jgi:hypothetical protein